MPDCCILTQSGDTDPAFCQALEEAKEAGVKVIFLPCHVEPDGLSFAANEKTPRL